MVALHSIVVAVLGGSAVRHPPRALLSRARVFSCCLLVAFAVPTSAAGQPSSGLDALTAPPSTLPAGCALVPAAVERAEGKRVTGGLWAWLRIQSNPWTGETPQVLTEIRTRMFGLSPMPDGPPDARTARQIARTLVEGLSGYAAVYRQGDARIAVYALRSTDPRQWTQSSLPEQDDGTGQAFARLRTGRLAVLVVGDRGACFESLERHLRAAAAIAARAE
jgi:hypothetical protein